MSMIQASDTFGYHSFQQVYDKVTTSAYNTGNGKILEDDKENFKKVIKIANYAKSGLNVAGYIPVIGTIIAIAKLSILFIADKKLLHSKDNVMDTKMVPIYKSISMWLKIRSAIELTSLGFLLLIPDLIFTIGRAIPKNPKEQMI